MTQNFWGFVPEWGRQRQGKEASGGETDGMVKPYEIYREFALLVDRVVVG